MGSAEQRDKHGDLEGALAAYSEALSILGAPGVDLVMPWCRSAASLSLWGYCRAAKEWGRQRELLEMLKWWRPTYMRWMKSPATEQETEYLKWFEQALALLGSSQLKDAGTPTGADLDT